MNSLNILFRNSNKTLIYSKNSIGEDNKLNKIQVKQIKSKDCFEILRSNFILKRIIQYMKKNKTLEIIKYNKKLQNRLNLSINDYIIYSQLYTPIEIEINIIDNKCGNFINISNGLSKYYHIYFGNSQKEIERIYLNENEKVKIINIRIDYQVKSFKGLFFYCSCISSIIFKKFYRNNIIDMNGMFFECSSLKELNLSIFNTTNVTDMSNMFFGCSSLKKLNLSNFNTSNVTDMRYMFCEC